MKFSNWLGLAVLIAVLILLWSLKEILIQLFAGIVLAMAVCTLVDQLRTKIKMPRTLALVICLSGLLLILGVFLAIVVPPFTEEFQQLLMQLPTAARKLWELSIGSIDQMSDIVYGDNPSGIWDKRLLPSEFNPIPDGTTLASGLSDGIKRLLGFASNIGNGFLQILFIMAVTLMISFQPNSYREVAILLFPSFYRRRAGYILDKCGDALTSWMIGVLISSLCVAVLAGIGLSLLGVKLVIANALLAGILNVIPNLGPAISTIFPVSVALLDAPWKALAVVGLYVIIQNLESYLITPSVMHRQVKLLPGLTLTAQFIFTVIFGPLGLLLALPLAVVIQVFVKEILIKDLLNTLRKERLSP